ncbi:LuxR C-terminal-related transcriptional regulator [Enterobacter roggenkampii]
MHNGTDVRPEARVLSECALAQLALSSLLEEEGWSVCPDGACGEPLREPDIVLVWIALPLREVLSTLEALATQLNRPGRQPRVVVMGKGAPDWFWYSLRQQLPVARFPDDMLFVGADAPVAHLRDVLAGRHDGVPYRQVLMHRVHQKGGDMPGLTRREVQILRWIMSGAPVTEFARRYNLARKTVYLHRVMALTKLGTILAPGRLRHQRRMRVLEALGGQGHAFRQALSAGRRHDKA